MSITKRLIFLFLIILIILTGVWLRLTYAYLSPYNVNCDTADVGIMALHILKGEIPLFFYGQEYLGPFEALVIALFFIVFGISNFSMFHAMIFLSVLFLISTYFLAKEFGGKWAGIIALAFCSLAPTYFIVHNVLPLGYHVEILLLGNIIFILTLRLIKNDKLRYYILIGLIAGFGFWTQYIISYYLLPIALFLLMNKKWKGLVKRAPIGIACFFLGGLPFWVYTVTHRFGTFGFPPSERQKILSSIIEALPPDFSDLFNLRMPFLSRAHYLDSIVFLIYIISFIFFIYKSFRFHKNLLLIFFFISIVTFFGIYNYHALKGCAYYILPLYSLIPIIFGYAVSRMRGRYSLLGIGIVIFVVGFNGVRTYQGLKIEKKELEYGDKYFPEHIKFLKENKINRIICGRTEDYTIQFLTKEEVTTTGAGGAEYLPYDFIVERADKVGISSAGVGSIDSVCKKYKHSYDIYYDMVPYGYKTSEILPDNWRIDTSYYKDKANWAFDRNYDQWWSTGVPRKDGMYFTIDLGKDYTICKFQVLNYEHIYNYPMKCHIEVSVNGRDWEEVKYLGCIEPLFWSGPRIYWHLEYGRWEVIFDPVNARYLRLIQEGDGYPHPWEINEIFIYEFIGEMDESVKNYIKDAKKIYRFIVNKKPGFVYADFWLSAKIRWFSKENISVLRPFNGSAAAFDVKKNTSRIAELKPDIVFVVPKENQVGFEKVVSEFQLPLAKKEFNYYICYYFTKWNGTYLEMLKKQNWLYWIGIGMVKYNLKGYSDLIFSYAFRLENRGQLAEAIKFYKKSIEYYPNNLMSYLRLVKLYKKMGSNMEYKRISNIFRHKFIPKIKKQILFKNNIEFIGFTLNKNGLKSGDFLKIDYFWGMDTEELPPSGLVVFVHFIKDKKILFQNDHAFLSKYLRPLKILEKEVFRESFRVDIPEDLTPGEYEIHIGLWRPEDGYRVPLELNHKKDRAVIGEIQII